MPERYWDRHERETARLIGGAVVPGSGAGAEKLDARAPRGGWFTWLVSCKSTTGKGIRVTDAMLEEAEHHASQLGADARPMLAFRIYDPLGRRVRHDWVAVRADDFAELSERAK